MLLSYLKIAYRNLLRNKGYAFLNIVGLAVGLAVFGLVASFTDFHFSFDDFHNDGDRIYSLVQVVSSGAGGENHSARTPLGIQPLLLREFGEIESATRWKPLDDYVVKIPGKKFFEQAGTAKAVDSNFLSFFNFRLLAGDPESALADPNSVVLTASIARKYFGDTNPIGKQLTIKLHKEMNLKVSAVTEDAPLNSSLTYNLLVTLSPFHLYPAWPSECVNFIKLVNKTGLDVLDKKMPTFISRHMSGLEIRPSRMYLLALKDLHVDSIHVRGAWRQDPRSVYLLTLSIGIALLMVVCCNYMSLATAQYLARTGEVGIRKVVGGSGPQLVTQFLIESILIALIAFVLSIALYELMYPKFAGLIFTSAGPKITSNPVMLLKLFLVTLLVGIAAGSYPAFFLARLKPMEILRRVSPKTTKGANLRQILVVVQFGTSILLMVMAVLAVKQFDHLNQLDLGYNKKGVYLARIGYGNYTPDLAAIKNELKSHPGIRAVSAASYVPVDWETESRVILEGFTEHESWTWDVYSVDDEFIELLEMKIIMGHSFLESRTAKNRFIINETAVHLLPWDDPIGKPLNVRGKKGVIIGVVRDFHFRHIFFKKMPSVLCVGDDPLNYLYIKLEDSNAPDPVNYIKDRWKRFNTDIPFEYATLEEYFQRRYAFYRNLGILISGIGIIAAIFSILGLLGLTAYATRRRTKEIGIRKAHGATVSDIILLFLVYFLRLILLANLIALPVTHYAAKKLVTFSLPVFPMEVDINVLIFVSFLSLVVAVATVIFQTYIAAVANPVDSLRYE